MTHSLLDRISGGSASSMNLTSLLVTFSRIPIRDLIFNAELSFRPFSSRSPYTISLLTHRLTT